MKPPRAQHWLFWDVKPAELDLTRDKDYILARVLEFGRLEDVQWLLARYGIEAVHEILARPRASRALTQNDRLLACSAEGEG